MESFEERLRKRILEKLKDLTKKIEDNEDLPESDQDIEFLSDVNDRVEEILNAWYY